jgi:septal ring factor EnvC (AmiA/AmiB activator)
MATQDLQSLKAELHDVEGEMHRIAAKVERIERERAAGSTTEAESEDELRAAREDKRIYQARRDILRRQITELGHTLEDY